MKIGIGRKQLVISVQDVSSKRCKKAFDIPFAVDATDNELARLSATRSFTDDRARWETNALLYGAFRLLES